MNYDEMSDFNINFEVFKLSKQFEECKDIELSRLSGPYVSWGDGANWHRFDAVSSPSEYMPLAIEHEISINFDDGKVEVDVEHPHNEGGGLTIFVELDKSQLGRAICIAYLKMMEAKREK